MTTRLEMTEQQKTALARIRASERLAEYEFELMTDWAYTGTQENWEWIAEVSVDELIGHAQTVRDELIEVYGQDYKSGRTWEDNVLMVEDANGD